MNRMGPFKSCSRLFCNASDNELGGVDDRKALGIVTALKIKRLVLGGVDMRAATRHPLAPPTSHAASVATWNLSVQAERFAWLYTAVIKVGI